MVKDVVEATLAGDLTEIRMSGEVLEATLELRSFLFERRLRERVGDSGVQEGGRHPRRAVGEGPRASRGLSRRRTIDDEGVDAAARDFLAGMTDRYAVRLFEQLFIPKPWVGPIDLVDGQ